MAAQSGRRCSDCSWLASDNAPLEPRTRACCHSRNYSSREADAPPFLVIGELFTQQFTLNENDGVSHTYTLDPQTMTHGKTLTHGEDVFVVTLNNASNATAVVGVDPLAMHGNGAPWAQH